MPGRFTSWYPGQLEAHKHMMSWLHGPKRFFCLQTPTGGGKSALGALTAILGDRKAIIATVTKGLQEQLIKDFATLGMRDVRGQANYSCVEDSSVTVDNGPCHRGYDCMYRQRGCHYYDALGLAISSPLVVTNYSYLLAQEQYSETGLGPRDLLICDEAHLIDRVLTSHFGVSISHYELARALCTLPGRFEDMEQWRRWAHAQSRQSRKVKTTTSQQQRRINDLTRKLDQIAKASDDWVWELEHDVIRLGPVWLANYASHLFGDRPKVILMSASLVPKDVQLLGLDPSECEWHQGGNVYPAENAPVYHINTVPISYKSSDDDLRLWTARIDQILDRRADRKGIIFTVSYQRQQFLLEHSRHAGRMITHDRHNTIDKVDEFRRLGPGAVLVSPAVAFGWDFPSQECEYVIIGKVPWPSTQDPISQRRREEDKDWAPLVAMSTVVQCAGRGQRTPTDLCEVLITDDNWRWFWAKYKYLAPSWFHSRVCGSLDTIPQPIGGAI